MSLNWKQGEAQQNSMIKVMKRENPWKFNWNREAIETNMNARNEEIVKSISLRTNYGEFD